MNPNDWTELGRRLDIIESSLNKPKSKWETLGVPIVAWLAAIASALLTAWFTSKFEAHHAGMKKDAEVRAETLANDQLELYEQISVLREKVVVGFERFLKTKGRLDKPAEEASKSLLLLLSTKENTLPTELLAALRDLNNYVNTKKAELSKMSKDQWKFGELMKEAGVRNDVARSALSDWFEKLKGE